MSVDADVRDEVIRAAREVERLSASDIEPERYFPAFLRLAAGAVGADAGAVWLVRRGRLELCQEWELARTGLRDDPRAVHHNRQLLAEVLSTGEAKFRVAADVPTPSAARRHLVLAPLHAAGAPSGVVQLFLPPHVDPDAHAGYLQFVEQLCGWASKYLERRRANAAASSHGGIPAEFADFLLRLQRARTTAEAADTVAADCRLLLHCDRLSIAVRRGRKTTIDAVSGQHAVNARGNLLRGMVRLADACIATGEPLTFAGGSDAVPPSLEEPLAAFLEESGARLVVLVPLFPPETTPKETDDRRAPPRREAFGCLVIERFGDGALPPGFAERVDLVTDHIAAGLAQALELERIFLLPLWRAVGRAREWFHGRRLWKTAAVLGTIAFLVLGLALIPWTYRVEAEGRLVPVEKRRVFAPQNGEVIELFVSSGERVAAGQPLLVLKNDELRTQTLRVRTELQEKRELVESLRNRIDAAVRQADRAQEADLQGQRVSLLAETAGLADQLHTLEERATGLTVRAPIEGTVATFQLDELLRSRPVRRGDVLLEVMRDSGPWQLELDVKEHRVGHLLAAQQRLGNDRLTVDYVLASAPEQTHTAALAAVAAQAIASPERGNVVEVTADVPSDRPPPQLRIGAEVRARIRCGSRSLGYVLFGDVIEFVWTLGVR